MAAQNTLTSPFTNGDRVVATSDLAGVREGTAGTVKMASGLTWLRYWVEFDGGPWIGSVSQAHLVRAKDWEDFKRRREEERLRPKEPEKPVDAGPADGGGDGGAPAASGAASRVPAHLLERSRQARARLSGS